MHKIFTGNGQITAYRPWPEERKAKMRATIAAKKPPSKKAIAAAIADRVDRDLAELDRLCAKFGFTWKTGPFKRDVNK